MIGRRVGDFVITGTLGAGAEAAVFRARQEPFGREAAIKIRKAVGPEVAALFLEEARLASRLDHPLAAHVYAFGVEEDGLAWLALELVDGATLAGTLAADGPMAPGRFAGFFERLCETVEHGHRRGVVHGDLKPANVVVVSRGQRLLPRLIDLGVGVHVDAAAGADDDRPVGSPAYMAPELWGDPSSRSARSDVYALGVLAYESLTGRLPFTAPSLLAMARRHRTDPLPAIDGPAAPAHAVLARATAKRPEDRHAGPLELAAALRAAFGATEETAPPQLDEALRDALVREAPQPIAEAVAALEAAPSVVRAGEAAQQTARTLVRWLGVVALAARAHGHDGAVPEALRELLVALRRGALSDEDWIALAREAARDSEVLPELAALFVDGSGRARPLPALTRLLRGAPAGDRVALEGALEDLDSVLRATSFLSRWELAVARDGRLEAWTGVRRRDRRPFAGLAAAEPSVCLVHGGERRVELVPLAQALPPAPGAERELFLLEGAGRRGARLRAWPTGFERHDDAVWGWLAAHGAGAGEDPETARDEEAAPYRGLEPFGRDDGERYVGRERETEAFLNRLRVEPLLVLAGPSGAGKSSFVHAGVVPALPADWSVVSVRPGATPLATLRAGLAARTPALLIVDQLEELFTLCPDADERVAFAAALVATPARVVLVTRDDFLARLEELAPLRHRLARGLELLATPLAEDLHRVLVEPARRAGYRFEDDDVPARMVAETLGRPAALPLLSFAARAMWDLRDRVYRVLPRRAHEAIGGVGGALARHAEAVLASLSADDRRAVRELFRHLVNREGTRVPLRRADALTLMGGAAAEPVLERLVGARLVTALEGAGREDTIELVHEALLEGWPRLRDWVREDGEWARLRDQLRGAAQLWIERGRPRGLLWRHEALDEYRVWRTRYPGRLTSDEEEFARASEADAARGRRWRRAAVAGVIVALAALAVFFQRQAAETRRRNLERLVEQGRQLVLAGDPLRAFTYLAEAARGGRDDLATRVLLREVTRPIAARRLTLPGHGQPLTAAAWSVDGRTILTAGRDGTASLWDGAGRRRWIFAAGGPILAAALDPRGRVVATCGRERWVRIWDAAGGALRAMLPVDGDGWELRFSPDGGLLAASDSAGAVRLWETGAFAPRAVLDHLGPPRALAFNPAGTLLATGDHDGKVRLWDTASGALVATAAHGARVWDVAFAPGGERLVSASEDRTATVWSVPALDELATFHGHTDGVLAAAFMPDGSAVVTGSLDGTANIVDAATGKVLRHMVGHRGAVRRVAISGDGRRVLTLGQDGNAILWAAASGRALARYPHADAVLVGQLSPDGAELVTGASDGDARVWRAVPTELVAAWPAAEAPIVWASDDHGGHELAQLAAGTMRHFREDAAEPVTAAAPDGEVLALAPGGGAAILGGADGAVLWDGARTTPVPVEPEWAIFTPDGLRVALFAGTTVTIWDRRSGATTVLPRDDTAPIGSAAFAPAPAPAGGLLALAVGPAAELWSPDGTLVGRLEGHGATINDLAWCATGARLLTASEDMSARWWDVAARTTTTTLESHASPVTVAAVAPDCRLVATGSGDGKVRVWEVPSGRLLYERPLGELVTWAAFSPDGARLAASNPGELVSWPVERDAIAAPALADFACQVPFAFVDGRLARARPPCP